MRFWALVEELATEGDQAVENAVWVSLIEWFAWGSTKEKAALVDAGDLQGPQTKAITAHYLHPMGLRVAGADYAGAGHGAARARPRPGSARGGRSVSIPRRDRSSTRRPQ